MHQTVHQHTLSAALSLHAVSTGARNASEPCFAIFEPSWLSSWLTPALRCVCAVGLALESSRSLQAGETLLLSTPLALVSHTAEELAGLPPPAAAKPAAAAAKSQGVIAPDDDAGDDADDGLAGDESGYDEGGQQYEPSDADIDQLAEQLGSSSSNARTQVGTQTPENA
jgi:hypothetical protein